MRTRQLCLTLRRVSAPLLLGASIIAVPMSSRAAVEECQVGGKWINLSHGGMTRDLTGLVQCMRDGKPTREIPYLNGKVHGVQKRFGGMGSSDQVVHTEFRDGKRNGIQRTFDSGGRLVSEVTYADDREAGLTRHYHANGKLKRETDIAQRDQDSLTHDYDEQGRLASITCGRQVTAPAGRGACRYRDHTGALETYWPDGKLRTRGQFRSGLLDGVFEHFGRDGAVQLREEMRAGYVHGMARALHGDGRVMQEAQYQEGLRHGALKIFHESGKLIEEFTFDHGALMRERTYYLNGEPRADTQRADERVVARGFWDNGKPRFEATFVVANARRSRPNPSTTFVPVRVGGEGRYNEWGAVAGNWPREMRQEGVEKQFHENGNLASEVTYHEGRRQGGARAWHENGKMAVEVTYAAGRVTARKEYDENGSLLKDEEYLEDGSRRRR